MNLIEIGQLLLVNWDKEELQSYTSLCYLSKNPLLSWNQRLYELWHLLDHFYESVVLFLLLHDFNIWGTPVINSQVTNRYRQIAIHEIVALGNFPNLGALKKIKLNHILWYLILDKILWNIQERIRLKGDLVFLDDFHLFFGQTEQKCNQVSVSVVDDLRPHRVHKSI